MKPENRPLEGEAVVAAIRHELKQGDEQFKLALKSNPNRMQERNRDRMLSKVRAHINLMEIIKKSEDFPGLQPKIEACKAFLRKYERGRRKVVA